MSNQTNAIDFPSGQPFTAQLGLFHNRTGGTLVVGGVYAVDMAGTVSESNPFNVLRNLVTPHADNIDGKVVIAQRALADKEKAADFIMAGPATALVNGSGTSIAKGDKLIVTAGSNKLTKSGATTDNCVAWALAASSADNDLIPVLFFGASKTPQGTAS